MISRNYLILISIPLILLSFSCTKKASEPELGAVLEKEIPELMKVADIPGLSMVVIRDREIFWSGAFGVRSSETKETVDEDTIFESASLSKTVSAYAALRLVDQGELDLDKPLAEYSPYEKLAGDERYKRITARMILTHTTGLPNWGNRLIREPGQLFGYSGEGFLYLGRTIEKLTGMSFQDYVKKEVFDPLGMTKSSYVWNDDYEANGAAGHDRHGIAHPKRKNTSSNAGASLLTTAKDYARFICAILNSQGLKTESIDQMLMPHVKATKWGTEELNEHISWGWGWGIQPGISGYGFWHWGNNIDFKCYTIAYRESGDGLAFFTNSENGFAIAEPLVSLVLDDPQWAFAWLDWKRYDDPERVAQFTIEKAFLKEGKVAGLKNLQSVLNRTPEFLTEDVLNTMGRYLDEQDKKEEALEVFKISLESYPQSVDTHIGLSMVYMGLDQNKLALENLKKASKLDPDNRNVKRGIPWIEEAIKAEENPVVLSVEELEKFAGDYGPRHVRLQENTLYYQRKERKEYRLKPMTKDTFALVRYPLFRLRFAIDKQGNVTKIVGIYFEGRTDESPRNK